MSDSVRRFAVLSSIGLTACGGGGGVSLDNLGSKTAEAVCARLAACCTTAELMDQTLGATDEASCRSQFALLVQGFLVPPLRDSVDSGRVVFHGDVYADCLAGYADLSCVEFHTAQSGDVVPAGCENPFEPMVAIGGMCAGDFDCVSTYCSGDGQDGSTIMYGTCITAPAPGMPCDDFECGGGAFCDSGGTCQALLASGAPCGGDFECASTACIGTPGACGVSPVCDGM